MTERVLPYDRAIVPQETGYWCGPASIQTVLNSRGIRIAERDIARKTEALEGNVGWDDQDGTDHIRQVAAVLNEYLPGAQYETVAMPTDPPTPTQRDGLWRDLTASINAGYGVVINIDAPASNYPKAVPPSTIDPAYAGGRVFHYFAAMGWSDDGPRRVWIADSGFSPFGYWIGFDQLASLVPPKGYTFAAVKPALSLADTELSKRYPSRSKYRANDEPVDTLAGFILNIDARIHERYTEARS